MKLTGNLKKQVEKAESKQEKKSLIENAGMLLNDDELEMVSGGDTTLVGLYSECIVTKQRHEWKLYEKNENKTIFMCRNCGCRGEEKIIRNPLTWNL
ncbi:MAG: hypothetical protein K5985_05525 [Lachnospiraceae bacterium]|nr:hypothetical protein [Lachnospiraceae bacterium]